MLAAFLRDFQIDINCRFFLVCFEISVFFFVNRIEVAKLIELDDRILPSSLTVDVAFVYQHFAAEHIVACESIPRKFEPAQRKLFTFLDRYRKVYDSLIRVLRDVRKGWRRFGRVLDKALTSVDLFQVFVEGLADFLTVGNVTLV